MEMILHRHLRVGATWLALLAATIPIRAQLLSDPYEKQEFFGNTVLAGVGTFEAEFEIDLVGGEVQPTVIERDFAFASFSLFGNDYLDFSLSGAYIGTSGQQENPFDGTGWTAGLGASAGVPAGPVEVHAYGQLGYTDEKYGKEVFTQDIPGLGGVRTTRELSSAGYELLLGAGLSLRVADGPVTVFGGVELVPWTDMEWQSESVANANPELVPLTTFELDLSRADSVSTRAGVVIDVGRGRLHFDASFGGEESLRGYISIPL